MTTPFFRYSPYPEITGYGASLFAKLYSYCGRGVFLERAVLAADSIVAVQTRPGGFLADPSGADRNIYTFDHLMMVNGLLDTYGATGKEVYLKSALRGLELLLERQGEDGSLPLRLNDPGRAKSHFCLVKGTIPLVKAHGISGDQRYARAAEKLARHAIVRFQKDDGGFRIEKESPECNRFHYMCYAVEGIISLAEGDQSFMDSVECAGEFLLRSQRVDGAIWYSFTRGGKPIPSDADLSATAQAARIFLYLHRRTHDRRYAERAYRAASYLRGRQHRSSFMLVNGGMPFGYHRALDSFGACSWATQFFTDLTLYDGGGRILF